VKKTLRLREPRPTQAGDPYTEQVDSDTDKWFADRAKEEGVSVSGWLQAHGIIGSGLASRIADYERPMSAVPPKVLEEAEVRTAEDAWFDRVPGGQPVASVLERGVVRFATDMPKRRRGRPFKRVRVQEVDR
jgi:hypothetical protein